MKHSYYNVLSDMEDGTSLLYNTYWESLVRLTAEELQLYEQVESASEEELRNPLYSELEKQHFILDDPNDEADWIQYEYEKYKFNNKVFELIICPTISCNYCCPYCYEKKRPGLMTLEIQDAVMRFVEQSYDDLRFLKLRVTWNGGEPLVGANVIETLSPRFMRFCEEKGIPYHASIMSNGSLADKEMMDRMYKCGVKSMMITFGGKGEVHDCQRPAVNGKSTFDAVYENTLRILRDGTPVNVEYVYDRDNLPSILELADDLTKVENAHLAYCHYPYPKTDYNGDLYDEDGNAMFDLQSTLEARADAFKAIHRASGFDALRWHDVIRPLKHFCGCHTERNYIIDELGYAYKCMCDMDKPQTHALFNVLDAPEDRKLNEEKYCYYMNYNPAQIEPCRTCPVMPICKGTCYIDHDPERFWVTVNCHPIKLAITDYVREYYEALQKEGRA